MKWREVLLRALCAHDAWAWFYGVLFLCILLILEMLRWL